MTDPGGRAIVIGASMGGPLAARGLPTTTPRSPSVSAMP
jgi:hypothetical protein